MSEPLRKYIPLGSPKCVSLWGSKKCHEHIYQYFSDQLIKLNDCQTKTKNIFILVRFFSF